MTRPPHIRRPDEPPRETLAEGLLSLMVLILIAAVFVLFLALAQPVPA